MRRVGGSVGQAALPAVVALLVVAMVGVLVIGRVGRAVVDRARARNAADAAALAGAHDGEDGARLLAERNGGELTAFAHVDDEVEVSVVVGGMRSSARARLESEP